MSPLDDANDLRGFHFRRLMAKPLTWILVGGLVVIAAAGGTAVAGPAIGGAAAVLALLAGLAIVFAIADSKAADDFFEVYAQQRGMTLVHGRGRLPQATPLPVPLHRRPGRRARMRELRPRALLPAQGRPAGS